MATKNPSFDRHIAEAAPFARPILVKLRALMHRACPEVVETMKWNKQRDYLEWLVEARQESTRAKRLATALEWLAEGKSRNWKYEKC